METKKSEAFKSLNAIIVRYDKPHRFTFQKFNPHERGYFKCECGRSGSVEDNEASARKAFDRHVRDYKTEVELATKALKAIT